MDGISLTELSNHMARILIVEDDPPSRAYLRTLLTATHHKVSEAGDGLEALKSAHALRPDLIITDILMPTMDGFEFVRLLRKDPDLAATRVIFCSATYLQHETAALAKSCCVTHTLIKPAEPQDIYEAVNDVLKEPVGRRSFLEEEFHRKRAGLVSDMAIRKTSELQIANERLSALITVGNQLASEPDAGHLIEKFCKGARYVLAARYTAVVLGNEIGKKFELAATSGLLVDAASPPQAFMSLVQLATKELRPVQKTLRVYDSSILNLFADPPFLDPSNPVTSCLVTGIASGNKLYGFLLAAGKVGRQDFTDEEEQVAGTLATQVAIAYENVLRVDQLQMEISERRKAEEALRQSETKKRELIEKATYGVYRSSSEGKFLEVNAALVKILGYESAAEVLALNLADDVYRFPSERAQLVRQCKEMGQIHGVEVQWYKKNKTPILVRVSARAVPGGPGGEEYFEVILDDITEIRALEKSNRELQKFEAVGQLAGGIAHDFNNVIGAVLGWAELGMLETTPDSRVHSYLEKIRTQAERAARLTKQLLTLARRQILELRSINLNQVVTESMEFLNSVVGKDIEIKLGLESELELTLADPTQIEQVLMNLCLNARDAMPKGGELLIETKNVTFDEEYCRHETNARLGSFVLMCVRDTGQGMDSATIDRIFEPFFTTKELGKGTGLGLATVYGIVKQHGGFVHVQSELDQGSAFHVYLPVASASSDTNEGKTQIGPVRGGRETILLAEDQEGSREIAKETLENLGYTVLCAADGEAAVKLFESNSERIALVLLDVLMPKLSGPDALEKMRARNPALLALFATDYSTESIRLELLRRLGAEILQKPFGVATLGHRVREILDQKS